MNRPSHDNPITHVELDPSALAVAQLLRDAQVASNAAGGKIAQQSGAYGSIGQALVRTLACGLQDSGLIATWEHTVEVATALADASVDNGEDLAYQVEIFNQGVIDYKFRV